MNPGFKVRLSNATCAAATVREAAERVKKKEQEQLREEAKAEMGLCTLNQVDI
jgi:hypothetical protein